MVAILGDNRPPKPKLKKTFTPYGDLIAFESIKASGLTEGGVQLPDDSQYETPTGWVVAVGPDVKQAKVGDRLLALGTTKIAQTYFKGQQLWVVHEADIIGIVD